MVGNQVTDFQTILWTVTQDNLVLIDKLIALVLFHADLILKDVQFTYLKSRILSATNINIRCHCMGVVYFSNMKPYFTYVYQSYNQNQLHYLHLFTVDKLQRIIYVVNKMYKILIAADIFKYLL